MLNAEKNAPGRIMPPNVLSSPRSFISTKFGSSVNTDGTISAVSSTPNTTSRPFHRSRANA